jgi:predicted transporter
MGNVAESREEGIYCMDKLEKVDEGACNSSAEKVAISSPAPACHTALAVYASMLSQAI